MTYNDFLAFWRGGAMVGLLCAAVLLGAGSEASAQGPASAGRAKSAVCAGCHGADGNSINPLWPSLAGQHADYTARQLRAYQAGDRSDVLMSTFAANLTAADIADLAAYFETQMLTPKGADPDLVTTGEHIYRGGIAERGVAACIACHGPAGRGNPLAGYPSVSGQHAGYIVNTLRAYAAGERRSDASMNLMMRDLAALLSEAEMQAVASYMQGLHGATN